MRYTRTIICDFIQRQADLCTVQDVDFLNIVKATNFLIKIHDPRKVIQENPEVIPAAAFVVANWHNQNFKPKYRTDTSELSKLFANSDFHIRHTVRASLRILRKALELGIIVPQTAAQATNAEKGDPKHSQSDKEPQKKKRRPTEKRIKENDKIREAIQKLSTHGANIEHQPTAKSIAIETGIKEQTVRDSPPFKKAKDNKQVFVRTARKAHRKINTDKSMAREYEISKFDDTHRIEPSEAEAVRQLIIEQKKDAEANHELDPI